MYLVGGAVRDYLLQREVKDLDFVVPRDGLKAARRVADEMGAAYYPLDRERETGRVIWSDSSGERHILDFAVYRSSDLQGDLLARDLTINAMAIDIDQPNNLIDPLNGLVDLRAGKIRGCAPDSFVSDPVRILRAVRFATVYEFQIVPETRQQMRAAVPRLPEVSPERLRDEVFRMFDSPRPSASILVLDRLGGMTVVFPELENLHGLAQSEPHVKDAWQHTRDVVARLEQVLGVLSGEFDAESASNLYSGMLSLRLGRYRQQIQKDLQRQLSEGRSIRSLLFFAALYHDVGKPLTQTYEESGRIRFFDHDRVGSEMIVARSQRLHLSNPEVSWLSRVVRHHLRPILLAQNAGLPSRKAIYRFFRDVQDAGTDVCLLSLADVWGTYGIGMPQGVWDRQIEVVRAMLEAYWEKPDEMVSPPVYVNGRDLIQEFSLQHGPTVGKLLEGIREAAASGLVNDRQQALDLARLILAGRGFPQEED
ncbi:MAG: CCA tRNA nucleotidyltransferase [Anaerolineales bacterium]